MSLTPRIALEPASTTKHLPSLLHPLPSALTLRSSDNSNSTPTTIQLSQSDAPGSTGTTLWLSAQVLSAYLASQLSRDELKVKVKVNSRRQGEGKVKGQGGGGQVHGQGRGEGQGQGRGGGRVLELGSGIGYLSLCLASWGYQVTSTDIEPVLSSVLSPNIKTGLEALGLPVDTIHVRQLDWTAVDSDLSILDSLYRTDGDSLVRSKSRGNGVTRKNEEDGGNGGVERHGGAEKDGRDGTDGVEVLEDENQERYGTEGGTGFEMILTTDTIYHPPLVLPLWNLLRLISTHPSQRLRPPIIWLGLERRDNRLINDALEVGREMGFIMKQISRGKLRKAFESVGWVWNAHDWDSVEVWNVRFKVDKVKSGQQQQRDNNTIRNDNDDYDDDDDVDV